MDLTRNMKQTLTYWAPSSTTDINGKPTYTAPVQLICRWEDQQNQFYNKKGQEVVSKSRVFMVDDVDIDGYIFLGTSAEADPRKVSGAWEIQAKGKMPNLRNSQELTTVTL